MRVSLFIWLGRSLRKYAIYSLQFKFFITNHQAVGIKATTYYVTDLFIDTISHWDFLTKFLSFHYHITLEGVLGVTRSGQAQGTIICLVCCFSAKMEWHSKNLQKLSKSSEKLLLFRIFSEFVQFWLENSNPNQLGELKLTILLLLTPNPSLEEE